MSKLYTFSMPFHGRMDAWVEAESEEEAFELIRNGDWEDSAEQTFESEPDKAVLILTEELDSEGKVIE